jgi:hypothetical protein
MRGLAGQESLVLEVQQTLGSCSKPFRSCIDCLAAFVHMHLLHLCQTQRFINSNNFDPDCGGDRLIHFKQRKQYIQTLQAGKFWVLTSPCLGCRCLTPDFSFHPACHRNGNYIHYLLRVRSFRLYLCCLSYCSCKHMVCTKCCLYSAVYELFVRKTCK